MYIYIYVCIYKIQHSDDSGSLFWTEVAEAGRTMFHLASGNRSLPDNSRISVFRLKISISNSAKDIDIEFCSRNRHRYRFRLKISI